MWRVLKKMTEYTKSAVMLDGELSKLFDIEQGVPQGCTLSPTLFQVFINDLLEVVEAVRKGVKVGDTETSVSGMLRMLDQVLGDLLKVEEAGDDVEVLRRSLAPIRTLRKDAGILARAAAESGASSSLLESARAQIDETVRSGYSDCSFASVATTIEEEFCDAADKEGDPR
ncbi:unnamed protein product [Ectocarpus sp. CCAP 1310/34]|nr:unnamed protein product [Ectocarpus sp. CCAP 1310/34]